MAIEFSLHVDSLKEYTADKGTSLKNKYVNTLYYFILNHTDL